MLKYLILFRGAKIEIILIICKQKRPAFLQVSWLLILRNYYFLITLTVLLPFSVTTFTRYTPGASLERLT